MSSPPRISQLSGDYSRDALPIQQAMDSVGQCLKGGLTVAENLLAIAEHTFERFVLSEAAKAG